MALRWLLLATSLIVGLAGLMRIADPTPTSADDIARVIRLPAVVTGTILSLFGIATIVFMVGVMRRMRSKRSEGEDAGMFNPERPQRSPLLQAFAQLLSILNFTVVAFLLWKNVLPIADLMSSGAGSAAGNLATPAPSAPSLITWTFAALALIAAVAALAFALWFTSGDRLARWLRRETEDEEVPPPMVTAVDESLEDLRAEPDARRAIIRCYARFERAAAASGLSRMPWHTPMEFMREALSRLPAPRSAVHALTGLFELARFSDRSLGGPERDRALDALDDIKAAIDVAR